MIQSEKKVHGNTDRTSFQLNGGVQGAITEIKTRSVFRTQIKIYDRAFFREIIQRLLVLSYFCEEATSHMFYWILNTPFKTTKLFRSSFKCWDLQ